MTGGDANQPGPAASNSDGLSTDWRDRLKQRSTPQQVARIFLVFSLIFGVIWVFLIPPLQTPDELNHICRAYMLSEGRLIGRRDPETGAAGDLLPASLPALAEQLELDRLKYNKHEKVNSRRYAAAIRIRTRAEERVFIAFPNTLPYVPAAYVPQVLAIWVGRAADLPLIWTIYLMRLFTLALATGITWLALRRLPFLNEHVFLVALLPMALQQYLAPGADAILISVSLLFTASVLQLAFTTDEQKLGWQEFGFLAGLGIVVGTAKIVYAPVCLTLLLIPPARFRSQRDRIMMVGGTMLAVGLCSLGWFGFAMHSMSMNQTGKSSMVAFALDRPLLVGVTVGRNLMWNFIQLKTYQMIYGLLGWLDTPIPIVFALLHGAALVVSLMLERPLQRRVRTWKLATLGLSCGLILALINAIVLLNTNRKIYAIQGRYYLILLPLLAIVCHALLSRWTWLKEKCRQVPTLACYLAAGISLAGATIAILKRFYLSL